MADFVMVCRALAQRWEGGESITPGQLVTLQIMFKQFVTEDRDERLVLVSDIFGFDIGSFNDLSKAQASALLEMAYPNKIHEFEPGKEPHFNFMTMIEQTKLKGMEV